MNATYSQINTLVSPKNCCQWENLDFTKQKEITQAFASSHNPHCIIYPQNPPELAAVIAYAYNNNRKILLCSGGSKLGWGGLVQNADIVVSTEGLNQIIEHAIGDLTVTVEAGTKFADLQAVLAKSGQFLPLDPTSPESATIGGIIATADTGSLRQRYGGVRDLLLGITFVRADGQIATAGGQVVKNVAGYDLMKLFTGSYGTLGAICQATLRVYPLPEASETVVLTGDVANLTQATKTLRASALTPAKFDLLSPQLVTNLQLGEGMGLIASFASLKESVKQQSATLVEVGKQLGLQSAVYADKEEVSLWDRLQQQMRQSDVEQITCKIGVLPSAAVEVLLQLDSISGGKSLIHALSGLGMWKCAADTTVAEILKMRSHCQSNGGFLTILEAPINCKQQLDVWGYSGNSLELMRKIKHQFDPKNVFNPHRFVGGI
ncbi:FAD-binding oxidoreductase [Synechocystis sp. PCC 7509]|uniref:FAD-binding oxidoreductase n=1 Tax=Synechocystis sp. PCC 7509 TaxID=927677 RepID=UPI0002ACEC6E|nr:FAD-binding oxidoreductase [Synechocystis sp. PCC 7509]